MMGHRKRLLFNPGPVTLSRRVRKARLRDDLCHREPAYAELQQRIRQRLSSVYEESSADFETVLLTGSGTAAVESMVGSLVPSDGRALVIANGIYGERIAQMLQVQRKPHHLLRFEWTESIRVDDVERCWKERGPFTHAIAVHHETTTGRLNDISPLARLCERRGAGLLVDAVSSFAGEAIDFNQVGLHACAATANKCLHGVPGVCFAIVRREPLMASEGNCPSLYLNLLGNFESRLAAFHSSHPACRRCCPTPRSMSCMSKEAGRHGGRPIASSPVCCVANCRRTDSISCWRKRRTAQRSRRSNFQLV